MDYTVQQHSKIRYHRTSTGYQYKLKSLTADSNHITQATHYDGYIVS